jgi:hypothetical protein
VRVVSTTRCNAPLAKLRLRSIILGTKAFDVPAETHPPRWNAHEAVSNVLAGKTADGRGILPLAIPFTKDPQARVAAAEVVASIAQQLRDILRADAVTPLVAKLLAHFCKTGLQSADAIRSFPVANLTDAIREAPELITGRPTITAILRRHHKRSHQAAATLKATLPSDTPPRTVLWEDGH